MRRLPGRRQQLERLGMVSLRSFFGTSLGEVGRAPLFTSTLSLVASSGEKRNAVRDLVLAYSMPQ